MKVQATAKFIRQAPRKVRLVVDLIRGLPLDHARAQLVFSRKTAAQPVLKVLNSAAANATHNAHLEEGSLVVKEAFVNEGPTIHRYTPRAHGRASKIRKRMSHITIVLEGAEKEKTAPKKTAKKSPAKKEAPVAQKKKISTKKGTRKRTSENTSKKPASA